MGKKRRLQIKGEDAQPRENGRIRAWWGRRKEAYNEKVNDALDNATYEAHKKYYPRWMRYSGCNHPNLIHWDDPQISLEAKLCDPRNLRLIRKGRHLDEFFEMCSPEEIHIYKTMCDEDGHRYSDLEDGGLLRSIIAGIKQKWKEKRGADMTSEEEEALDRMLSDEEDEDAAEVTDETTS